MAVLSGSKNDLGTVGSAKATKHNVHVYFPGKGKRQVKKSCVISIRTDIFQGTSSAASTADVFDTFRINW